MDYFELLVAIIGILGSGSIAGVIIQNRIQKLQKIEEKLREERRKIYEILLFPFIQIFAKLDVEKARETVLSLEYRKNAFELTLLGSDNVVKAYSDMMQFLYKNENHSANKEQSEITTKELMRKWSHLLLEIRKDLGNTKTNLSEEDMLKHLIKDIDKMGL